MSEINNVKKPFTLPPYLLHALITKPSDAPAAGIYTACLGFGDSGMYPDETQPDILQLDTSSRRSGDSFDLSEPGHDVIGGTDSGLRLREVPEIPHKLYGVDMNQVREVLISAANIGGVWEQKRLAAVRVCQDVRSYLMDRPMCLFLMLTVWQTA